MYQAVMPMVVNTRFLMSPGSPGSPLEADQTTAAASNMMLTSEDTVAA